MRVALLHFTYAPVVGGVEQIVEQHARLLREAGHAVTVVCGWRGEEGVAAEQGIVVLPELGRGVSGEGDFEAETGRLAERLRPYLEAQEVVFLHNVCTMPFKPALTAALWRLAEALPATRFICWVHDLAVANPDYQVPSEPEFPWALFRRASPRFEYVAVSEHRRRQLLEHFALPPERCVVIPNGISPLVHAGVSPRLEALAREWKLLERDLLLLQPARLLRRKNVELSLEVVAALRAGGCDAALIITGPPDLYQAASAAYAEGLRELRRQLGLEDHVRVITGYFGLSESEVASLYRLCDAVLFPSRQEGFGLPVLEAALHRVPIFCLDLEPMRSLPGAQAGVFPESATPAEVAAKVMRQLEASPAIQARREVLRAYAWPSLYRNLIAPLLAPPQTPPPS